jgi:hypothetical protein
MVSAGFSAEDRRKSEASSVKQVGVHQPSAVAPRRAQAMGRRDGGPADTPPHEGGLCGRRLGHRCAATGAEIAAVPGRVADVPLRSDRRGMYRRDEQVGSRLRRKGVVRVAEIPQVEAEVAAWLDATSPAEETVVARRLNKAALDHVVHAPIGFYLRQQAWRKNITGIAQGPLPFFWGVSKVV